jgi:hypothetical protein
MQEMIPLLKINQDKIEWSSLSENPNAGVIYQ